ncbi:LAFA_0F09428g1_1 [Lachancea sp. 'fantastica']|nr:LAFA_0F09428g1_1 [Lachancea sp. 'fantastica']
MAGTSPSRAAKSSSRRRSTSATKNVDYSLDEDDAELRDDENDEDYNEDIPDDEDNEDDNLELENEKGVRGSTNGSRQTSQDPGMTLSRPSGPSRRGRPPKRKNTAVDTTLPLIDSSKLENGGTNNNNNGGAPKRPHLSFPVDENGDPLPVVNDEYTLPDDAEGDTKINRDGDLLGGRQFLVRTFTLSSRGERKYMLSTEPARAVGFRDSYLFFQYHSNLYKLTISQDERNDLIHRGIIPYSYRTRTITLVAARGVFKEFGAKIIVDGKNITDDYYAQRLRDEGRVVEGSYAREPPASFRGGANGLAFSRSGFNPAKNAVDFFDKRNHNIAPSSNISSTNWLYQHAAACSRFNSDLFYDRERVLLIEHQGLRDSYTNTLHLPQSTQSTKVLSYTQDADDKPADGGVVYETIIADKDLTRRCIGIKDVSLDIFEDVVDDDIKLAILEQQQFERNS